MTEFRHDHGHVSTTAAFKITCVISRPAQLTAEEFREWWLGRHAVLARQLPGLRRYTIGLAVNTGAAPDDIDGVAELWFDDEAAMEAAFHSPVGRQVAEEDRLLIGRRVEYRLAEYEIAVPAV